MNLSPHFTLEELTFSQTAARLGIDNTPSAEVIENLKQLCTVLERIRLIFKSPILISSGYRSPELNAKIGGAKNSYHCLGLAADITCATLSPKSFALMLKNSYIQYDQIILEYNRWVHIGLAKDGAEPRRECLSRLDAAAGYQKGIV